MHFVIYLGVKVYRNHGVESKCWHPFKMDIGADKDIKVVVCQPGLK